MKKPIFALLTALLLCLMPLSALAEGEETISPTPSPTPTQEASPTPTPTKAAPLSQEPTSSPQPQPAGLSVDTAHVYDGMDRSYDQGYAPKVSKGIATVVLPLLASGELRGNTLTATPNLGEPSGAPFLFRSYMKTVQRKSNTVQGGGKIASYLVRFDLKLKTGRMDGVYPVTITIDARGADGEALQQAYTAYVTITDGKDPNATPPPPVVTPAPKVIVTAAKVEPAPAVAGQPFTAKITLKNVSEEQAVSNMKITATLDSPDIALQQDSNAIYIDKLDKGESVDLNLPYQCGLKTPARQYALALAIEYDSAEGAPLSAQASVPFAVVQPLRVQLDAPKLPGNVNAGDTIPLNFQVMNLGRGPVYNVRCELDAAGLLPVETAFFGNLEAGSAKTASMDVFVGTRNMSEGHEGEEEYGYTDGKIKLIYEDEDGKEYTEETPINTTIGEPVIAAIAPEDEEKPKMAGQWWLTIAIGVVLAGALAAVLLRARRKAHGR